MESSGGNHQQPGAQDEPFFELLQQSQPVAVPTTGLPSSGSQIPKKMENSTDFHFGGDDVLPSFDFQPIRASGAQNPTGGGSSSSFTSRIEDARGRQGSPPSSYTSYEPMRSREPPPTYETPVTRPHEHEKESIDSATASAVERTMKKYADNLLRVLEGLTGRLSQLESSTQRLEHLFEEIKSVVADTHGEADGKLRSLESHILEVQRGVQLLRDRQEIFEAQSQLAKLQTTSKSEQTTLHSAPSAPLPPSASEPPSPPVRASSVKLPIEAAQQQVPEAPSSYFQPQPQLQLPPMAALPAPVSHQPPPPPQPQPQQQAHQQHHHQRAQQLQQHQQAQQQQQLQQPIQPSAVQSEIGHQPLHQQQPPPPPPQHAPQMPRPPLPPAPYVQQQHQQPPQSQHQPPPYSQQQPPQQAPQPPPIANYGAPPMPETPPYGQQPQGNHPGSQQVPLAQSSYPSELPSYHPSYGPPPRTGPPPPQQQLSQMPPNPQPQQPHNVGLYEASLGRVPSGQLALPGFLHQGHPASGASHYEASGLNTGGGYPGSPYRVSQPVPSAPSGGSGGGYPRLPVAQPVQHSSPSSGGGSGPPPGSSSSLSSNRVPVDEVIDKVTAMGFPKDMVRAVVRRLTENGQSVDLNVVLDKLMNGDSAQAPPKGWFGR